jgi:hypothetical protein
VVERGPGFAKAIRRELPNAVDALLDTASGPPRALYVGERSI